MNFFKKNHQLEDFSIWLIFLFVALLVFGQILNNFFVSDDFHWLVIARDTQITWQIFLTNYLGTHDGGSYNPFLVLIFKFFYSLFNTNYFGYHLLSIVLHASNGFLLYVLAQKIFQLSGLKNFKKLAWLAGVLFLLYPIHVEVISWLAAWPHLWVTFFYLLSLVCYFSFRLCSRSSTFRQNKAWSKLIYSVLFFILALLTKEIAISLPLVLMIWEMYFYSSPEKNKNNKPYLLIYFAILALFLLLRYFSIGLVFGYYASSKLSFSYLDWTANLAAFGGDFISFGFLRTIIYKAIYHYKESIVIVVLATLAFYFLMTLLKKKTLAATSLIALLFILAPVLVTGLHRSSFGGERYLYLATSFFVIFLVVLLKDFKINFKFSIALLFVFVILSLGINIYKLSIWNEASSLSQQIVTSYKDLNTTNGQNFLTVALPDNLMGAEVFRNNLNQALEIYYPDNHPNILPTLAYLEVNKENKNNQLLKWRQDDDGWFGESVDGSFVVTGITSITMNNIYWELWNYNYQNYKANIIRLIPEPETRDKIKQGELGILTFDRGVLKILE